ncbi:MAG: 50S ribosomal protein L5 [Ignavibacteriae bacterium]|nr:50S ribosomal protein L5 [Ignavibacteriota bacterium]MCB9216302.1 50S ribosomal protein L5 [Ignavibacteria bacterium]
MANKNTNGTSTPRLLDKYREEVVPNLMKRFDYNNVMRVPRLVKIAVNRGIGDAINDKKLMQDAIEEIKLITGQTPTVINAKHSISNFKLREGMPIGVRVTLRGSRMYEFFDRFVSIASPRIRDFRGFSDKSFDGRGNYTIGIREQIIFPEIDVDKVSRINGFDISFVTTAESDEEAHALLQEMGFPFRKREAEEGVTA